MNDRAEGSCILAKVVHSTRRRRSDHYPQLRLHQRTAAFCLMQPLRNTRKMTAITDVRCSFAQLPLKLKRGGRAELSRNGRGDRDKVVEGTMKGTLFVSGSCISSFHVVMIQGFISGIAHAYYLVTWHSLISLLRALP